MFSKMTADGYIVAVGTGIAGEQISEAEYETILSAINNTPTAPDGYAYHLRATDLEWVLVELPPDPDPEVDDSEALEILLGGNI